MLEVKNNIAILKKHPYSELQKVLDDKSVRHYLQNFHDKFVITPTDKANNNFSIVCKTFYIECLLKELSIREELKAKQKSPTALTNAQVKTKRNYKQTRKMMKNHNLFCMGYQKCTNPVKTKIHCCFAYMFYKTTVEDDHFLFKTDPNNMRKLLHHNQKNTGL